MCWSVPGRLIARDGMSGTVEVGGISKRISLELVPEAAIGAYILVHAGYGIQTVDEEKAAFTIQFFAQQGRNAEIR